MTDKKYDRFWKGFLKKAEINSNFFSDAEPKKGSPRYLEILIDKRTVLFAVCVLRSKSRVELCIQKSKEQSSADFKEFYFKRSEIEAKYAGSLIWEEKKNIDRRKITSQIISKGINNEDEWDKLQDELIDKMIRLVTALKDYGILIGQVQEADLLPIQ